MALLLFNFKDLGAPSFSRRNLISTGGLKVWPVLPAVCWRSAQAWRDLNKLCCSPNTLCMLTAQVRAGGAWRATGRDRRAACPQASLVLESSLGPLPSCITSGTLFPSVCSLEVYKSLLLLLSLESSYMNSYFVRIFILCNRKHFDFLLVSEIPSLPGFPPHCCACLGSQLAASCICDSRNWSVPGPLLLCVCMCKMVSNFLIILIF